MKPATPVMSQVLGVAINLSLILVYIQSIISIIVNQNKTLVIFYIHPPKKKIT
jgi:hypothetical protein